ncbi:TRAP transporter small permease subunit [Oceanispirochaeta sp.]|uniref:TRAP transporter small permease subunit n=1 Tax=Oceanispirochaeta sp. TaxID=2035350 RepID=UPI002629F180|nr:TRAP transporter small permease subunit [Oceanispirochaeta sp.]MDA3959107.1 TRAP transporter small permease subunit [Oceanispirochaeta sp.]
MVKEIIKKFVTGIDKMSDFMGQVVKYLILVLIFVLCFEVVSRYVFDKPTIWAMETSKMVFGAIGSLCWGYTLKIGGHVRVDLFYTMFSKKWKAIVDVTLTALFLLPIELILIYTGYKWAFFALKVNERMVDSSWLPPSAPFRFVLAIGFTLFFIQTIAEIIKDIYFLIMKESLIEVDDTNKKEVLI